MSCGIISVFIGVAGLIVFIWQYTILGQQFASNCEGMYGQGGQLFSSEIREHCAGLQSCGVAAGLGVIGSAIIGFIGLTAFIIGVARRSPTGKARSASNRAGTTSQASQPLVVQSDLSGPHAAPVNAAQHPQVQIKPRFCSQCGNSLTGPFCSNCGHKNQ